MAEAAVVRKADLLSHVKRLTVSWEPGDDGPTFMKVENSDGECVVLLDRESPRLNMLSHARGMRCRREPAVAVDGTVVEITWLKPETVRPFAQLSIVMQQDRRLHRKLSLTDRRPAHLVEHLDFRQDNHRR